MFTKKTHNYIDEGAEATAGFLIMVLATIAFPLWGFMWLVGYGVTKWKVRNGHQAGSQGAYSSDHEAECLCRSGGVCTCR